MDGGVGWGAGESGAGEGKEAGEECCFSVACVDMVVRGMHGGIVCEARKSESGEGNEAGEQCCLNVACVDIVVL